MNVLPRSARWICAALASGHLAGSAATLDKVEFNRDIRPLLSDICFACHGPDAQKVKGGLRLDKRELALKPAKSGKRAIVPGKPLESELVQRLHTTDPDDRMPPEESHKTLTAGQKDLLQRWIVEGAEYQGHWAYQPLKRPAVPGGVPAIDFLVGQRLGSLGLQPSPEADRRILVRRLYLDLLGLPPKPEEVDAFVADTSPNAYERLVDRLLASPHYGERMAIGWLDVVRFSDTIGYHSDNPKNIWPYRDYVIRSFNSNKPFDQFTIEQIAGDLLPKATLEQRVASGFNHLLLTTEEGGAQEKDYEARYLTDRVRAVGAVWLGQTVGCAQCHDHKFDPVSARDFYSLGAFFADIQEPIIGRRADGEFVPTQEQAAHMRQNAEREESLRQQYEEPHPEWASVHAAWVADQVAAIAQTSRWQSLVPTEVKGTGEATFKVRDDRSVLVGDKAPDKDTYRIRFEAAPERMLGLQVEALRDDSLPSKGPGRAGNGNFVLTEVVARIEAPGKAPRTIPFTSARASIEQAASAEGNPYGAWTAASTIDGDAKGDGYGWAILPEAGRPQRLQLGFRDPVTLASGETLVVELQQNHGQGNHTLGCFRIGGTTDPEALRSKVAFPPSKEIADLVTIPDDKRDAAQREKLFVIWRDMAPELADLRQRLADARKVKSDFEATVPRSMVTERNDKPRTVRILPRGNFLVETGDIVEPALPVSLSAATKPPGDRRLNRLDLAHWLVAPENPLTSRVVVNRTWRQFFGSGLSKVLDDLGAQGELPRNPALLDWLASEFQSSGWNLKHMVRLMVTSRTYRQVSTASPELLAKDPDNRELARQGRWRVEAEVVRDNALSVAGLLVPVVGGPSVRPYQPDGYWENLNFPQRGYDASKGADQYRRGLYTWWQRSYVHPSMLAFDAATREECAAERTRSNIPQQALVLLNDPTYVESARALAARVLREAPKDPDARLRWAFRQTVSRSPLPDELQTLRTLLDTQLREYRADPKAAAEFVKVGSWLPPEGLDAAELAAWTDLARALLNLHETVTRS